MKMQLVTALAMTAAAFGAAAADTYVIDSAHTFPSFDYNHLGFSTATGRFYATSGTIVLDLAKKTGSAEVSIDVNSVNTGVAKLDEHLKSPEFFDAAKYPAITFKSKQFKFDGEKLVEVQGELSVHGVTKPVTLTVKNFLCKEHPMKKVPACGADAVATIKRSDFGVGGYVPAVGDEVMLRLQIEAQKKS